MEQEYTITVFSENKMGLMARIVSTITRRHINIESLSVSQSSIEGIHRFTIVVILTEDRVVRLVSQIDKHVDVLKAFYYLNSEIVYQEIALYKVPVSAFANGDDLENIVRSHGARILSIEPEYIVIEKTGHAQATEALLEELKKVGIYEFVRSGRVAIVKEMEKLNSYLEATGQLSAG